MLWMCSARHQNNPDISSLTSGQRSRMNGLRHMSLYESLPVLLQNIRAAGRYKFNTAPPLTGFDEHLNLRIMPQGFKMSDPIGRRIDGFFIYYASGTKGYLNTQPVQHNAL